MAHTVLFVDDEPNVTEGLKRFLRKEPYKMLSAESAKEALEILATEKVDVVVSDEKMPGITGSEFLALVCKKYPDTIRMMLTGQLSMATAINAINEGEVYRFFIKPCNEQELAYAIRQALKQKELMIEAKRLLEASKQQASVIEKLKVEHPELVEVERDKDGAIVIDNILSDTDLDKLIAEITEQTKKISG